MVVVCEKCDTRFHLDDARVPAKGARVRCSRCKHAFFVQPALREKAEIVEELAADAARAGRMPVPEVTEDLTAAANPDRAQTRSEAPLQQRAEDKSWNELEEDWQFNDDSPSPFETGMRDEVAALGEMDLTTPDLGAELTEPEIATSDDALEGEAAAPDPTPSEPAAMDPIASIHARDAEELSSSLDDLGSPEDWNFVASDEAAADLAVGALGASTREVDEVATDAATQPARKASVPVSTVEEESGDRTSLFSHLAAAASIAGWILIVAAFALGMSAVVMPPAEIIAVQRAAGKIPIAGLAFSASQVESRIVENALVGDLFVVSGMLENPGTSPLTLGAAVRVQLLAEDQVPIAGATATAGPALEESQLRERDPQQLRQELEGAATELAQRSIWPGQRLRFDAVFETIPESTVGWVLESVPVTAPTPTMSSLPPTTRLFSE